MDLNTILIILGVVALVALIVHGLWSNRREKSTYFKNANTFSRTSQANATVEEPVGQSLPESNQQISSVPPVSESPMSSSYVAPAAPQMSAQVAARQTEKTVDDIKITIPEAQPTVYDMGNHRSESVASPTRANYDMPTPTQAANPAEMTLADLEAQDDSFEGINSSSPELREQLAELSTENHPTVSFNHSTPTPAPSKPKQTQGYIQLYLIPERYETFNGVTLIQALENLGFLFGDRAMYHRHLDLSDASPVLFSVANLEQPGSFSPYETDFATAGIVLFMHLPSPGNDLANLRMMIRAARTLAEDLQGVILTDTQEIFDAAAEQDYLSRVA